MTKLSAVIITKNEECNLPRCLASLSFVDEIILVDSGSTDRTRAIAAEHKARWYEIKWAGFGQAKQAGVDFARGEWILSIDADEEVSFELAEEIKRLLLSEPGEVGFKLSRRTNFLGHWIDHGSWYPDRVLRLFKKESGRFDLAIVHEKVLVEGKTGLLKGELRHYSFPDLETYFSKANRYASLGAKKLHLAGRQCRWPDLLVRPLVGFLKTYFIKQGLRDGWEGLMISSLTAQSTFIKYYKLRGLNRKSKVEVGDE